MILRVLLALCGALLGEHCRTSLCVCRRLRVQLVAADERRISGVAERLYAHAIDKHERLQRAVRECTLHHTE